MFDIEDSIGFYRLMVENYDDFVENSGSSRHAINCAISAYHIAEWIWGDWLHSDYAVWRKLAGVRDRDSFKAWIDQETPFFTVVKDLANGSKHFASKIRRTKSTGTYVDNDYVEPGYQEQYLEVEVDGSWIEAIIVVEEMVVFWERFLKTHRPQAVLPQPRNPFTHMPD